MDQARASRCRDVASGDRFALVLAAQLDPGRREELIEEFRPLIATVARPYCRHGSIDAPRADAAGRGRAARSAQAL